MVKNIYKQILFSLSSSHEMMSVKISIAYLHNNTLKAFTRSKLLCTQVKILQLIIIIIIIIIQHFVNFH